MVKRIASKKQREILKQASKFRKKKKEDLTDSDIKELVFIIAKSLKII